MPNPLKVPEPFSILGVQSNQGVCEQVVSQTISTVKIKRRGTRGDVENPAFGIQRHARPIVGGAAGLPRLLWPGVVAKLAGVRNGVKRPPKLAGSHVVGANVSGRSWQRLWIAPTNNDKILVNDS